jgi:hypothetical protein
MCRGAVWSEEDHLVLQQQKGSSSKIPSLGLNIQNLWNHQFTRSFAGLHTRYVSVQECHHPSLEKAQVRMVLTAVGNKPIMDDESK